MRVGAFALAGILTAAGGASDAAAQEFACSTGSVSELERSIREHDTHTNLLYFKFVTGYYGADPEPDFRPATLADVQRFLRALSPQRVAVLFHAFGPGRLCVWALTATQPPVGEATIVCPGCNPKATKAKLQAAVGAFRKGLGVDAHGAKVPRQRNARIDPEEESGFAVSPPFPPAAALTEISRFLLPERISALLRQSEVDTIVIVPISALGTVPFAALRLNGDGPAVLDFASVVIAPGFFAFKREPRLHRAEVSHPIVLGDPGVTEHKEWILPALPGARAEATEVARVLGVEPLLGPQAKREALKAFLMAHPDTSLIYIATHGASNAEDPLDASFLVFSDGGWPAAEIGRVRLMARPLVVLSACQTGLGKYFDVGTIGMARSWQRAGASTVVMSLWSVPDEATRFLMTEFIQRAKTAPAHVALREAMQVAKRNDSSPAAWAGFAVFGLPEIR